MRQPPLDALRAGWTYYMMTKCTEHFTPSEFRAFQEDTAPVWAFDYKNHRMLWANDAALIFWNASSYDEFVNRDYSSDSKAIRERLWQTVNASKPGEWARDSWTLFPGGTPLTALLDAKLFDHQDSEIVIVFRLVETLDFAQSDPEGLRMMLTARTTPVAVSMFNLAGELISENPAGLALRRQFKDWERPATQLHLRYGSQKRADDILAAIEADERFTFEFQLQQGDLAKVLAVTVRRIRDPVTGDVIAQITDEDITEKARLAESLAKLNDELESRVERRTQELAVLNERLRQSQKMEAIGKLTGGVAHDFNNLLAVVQGNAELLSLDRNFRDDLVEEIRDACRRGADLTRSLLAYSRQQPLNAEPVDLAKRGQTMRNILKRTLGAEINLSLICPQELWIAYADPGQVEDAILNLALNARDAMPDGGNLTIELANAVIDAPQDQAKLDGLAGEFISISVADTGTGMPADIIEIATDPFFTTKAVGEGSGLGLSMVYGFAKQSGGTLEISSQVGQGTTVTVYLPRSKGGDTAGRPADSSDPPLGHGETILVVEDDRAVLMVVERFLETLNYRSASFETAQGALEYLREGHQVAVLLSDVVLPDGMKGPELARVVHAEFPDLKVLFMSGYPEAAAREDGFIGPGAVLLSKPLSRQQLANAIRDAL